MTTERDLAEAAAFERRRLVRACFADAAAEGPDLRCRLRLVTGSVAAALVMLGATAARGALASGSSHADPSAPPGATGVSRSPPP